MPRSRRAVAIAAILLSITPGCSPTTPDYGDLPPASPGLELGTEDYPAARRAFSTRLIREGPAAANRQPPRTPDGAVEVEYLSSGRSLKAYASPPRPGARRGPAVLFLHGGYSFGEGHWAMTRPFREAGYVVMVPTLRGENGQPGACSLFFDEVDDVLSAADVLAARPDVDPGRLHLAGHSVGGTSTLLAALTSKRFRAAASFSGSPDRFESTRNRPDQIPFDGEAPGELRLRSPVAFADRFKCPVRLYYGEEEYWLQSSTRRTTILARKAGLDVEAIEVPGGHESANPEVIARCIAFFRAH